MVAVPALIAPWAFHVGNRWTPVMVWQGVGKLQDSTGKQYGLYLSFSPDLHRGRGVHTGPAHPTPRVSLRGTSLVCTSQGLRIPFVLRGDIYGAWLNAEGKEIAFTLREQTNEKQKRHFSLSGSFQGSDLEMDDDKSMFMYLQPDGRLTPARSYTSPVPEKHAKVNLHWGTEDDFSSLCQSLHP